MGANMAEVDYNQFDSGYQTGIRAGGFSHAMNMAGAVCSVALVVGLGVWGYNLAVRDVTGVPVMRALAGPMRVAPDQPGGDIASHQGLSVNAVAAVGTAAALPDQVVLAPPPVALTLDDAPGLSGPQISDPVIVDQLSEVLDLPTLPAGYGTDEAIALALADVLAEGAVPLTALADQQALALLPNGPLAASPRPQARPGSQPVPSDVQSVAAVTAPVSEIDPTTLAVGTTLVQLGAFDDEAVARAEWARLQVKFGDLMASKSLVIEPAQSGGSTFYRLRAHGFSNEDDARRFCAALFAEGAGCIPAAQR